MKIKCSYCGKEIDKKPSRVLKYKRNYCDDTCKRNSIGFNEINILNDYAEITINSKKYGVKKALIDIEDVDIIKEFKWTLQNGYAVAWIKTNSKSKILIHRLITNCPKEMVVDHINHNTLDNRKSNLKICTQFENMQNQKVNKNNKTGHTGITYNKKSNKYYVNIQKYNVRKFIGSFNKLSDAVNAKNEYEVNYEL